MGRRQVTLTTVAAEAGVSVATASKALSTASDVAAATRARVRAAARQLGYERSHHRPRIQVAADTLGNPYTPFVVQGLLDEAKERDIDIAIALSHGRSQPHEAGSTGWIMDAADAGFSGAVIITLPVDPEHAQAASARGLALVAVDPVSPVHSGVPTVRSSNQRGAFDATAHLLGLGHTRIAAILGKSGATPSTQRLVGFQSALEQAGISIDTDLIRSGDFRYEGGLVAGNDLLRLPDPPTAVFALNDHMAMGLMEAARRRGLRVPEDLSIVGFDDVEWARWSTPPLTSVRQPLEAMGAEAIRLLDAQMRGRPPEPRELSTRLIVRGSTAPAPTRHRNP